MGLMLMREYTSQKEEFWDYLWTGREDSQTAGAIFIGFHLNTSVYERGCLSLCLSVCRCLACFMGCVQMLICVKFP